MYSALAEACTTSIRKATEECNKRMPGEVKKLDFQSALDAVVIIVAALALIFSKKVFSWYNAGLCSVYYIEIKN